MNIADFIASRILKSDDKTRISRPIVRIATIGIAVGVAMMLVSIAIVNGFQKEIRDKVIGFGSHFQVISNERNYSRDSQQLQFDPEVYSILKNTEGVSHVQVFATKPGIIETSDALQGVIIKGVDKDFDWSFLKKVFVAGEGFDPDSSSSRMDIIISEYIANRLKLKAGDRTSLYFFNEDADPRQRNFTVRAIYNTGLEDFDEQFVFVDIAHVQRLAGWGLRLEAQVDSVCFNGHFVMGAQAFGGSGEYHYKWTDPEWEGEGPHFLATSKDSIIQVIAMDDGNTIPDTTFIHIDYVDDVATEPCRPYVVNITSTESDRHYIGGYEVQIKDYDKLLQADDRLFGSLTTKFLQTQKITDRNPEIFSWLEMLDINVIIIIILMIVISVVNMTSALLIIILERQNMIGTLKAMGIEDNAVMSIFIRNAAHIIGRGMLWGNILGIGFAFLQWKFKIISLDPANYYVDHVPVQFDLWYMLLLDAGTLAICIISMIIPALYVIKISPIKAIRFS
ncbi:MAG: ABC transporter permease [Flavobacteriales bacterium]|nr:ABC transporter permease [Flavobacteriales bacterium]